MPPRKGKEPKEQIVYAASTFKTPAYKPLRPSKAALSATTESATGSSLSKTTNKSTLSKKTGPAAKTKTSRAVVTVSDSEAEGSDDLDLSRSRNSAGAGGDEAEDDNAAAAVKTGTKKRKASALSIHDDDDDDDPTRSRAGATAGSIRDNDNDGSNPPPPRPLSPFHDDGIPGIPKPLLLRLLHESFADKATRIDKHALQVVETYVQVFVREAIARCVADKQAAAERGEVAEGDVGWLEVEDLEKIGAGLMLDF